MCFCFVGHEITEARRLFSGTTIYAAINVRLHNSNANIGIAFGILSYLQEVPPRLHLRLRCCCCGSLTPKSSGGTSVLSQQTLWFFVNSVIECECQFTVLISARSTRRGGICPHPLIFVELAKIGHTRVGES